MQPSFARRGRSTTAATHGGFFTGESSLGNGVYYLALPNGNPFGYYSYLPDPNFIYHFDMGYEYVYDAGDDNGVYLYDFASTHWWYTSRTYAFPYLYDFSLNAPLYYFPDAADPLHYSVDPRYFFEFGPGTIITLPATGPTVTALSGTATSVSGSVSASSSIADVTVVSSSYTSPSAAVPVSFAINAAAGSARTRSPQLHADVRTSASSASSLHELAGGPYGPTDGRLPPPAVVQIPGNRSAEERSVRSTTPPSIGAMQNFYVAVFPIGGSTVSYQAVPFTLVGTSPHTLAWVQTAVAPAYASRGSQLAIDTETALVSDSAWLGVPWSYDAAAKGLATNFAYCDANGMPMGSGPAYIAPFTSVNVLLVDPSSLGAGVGGDFSPIDMYRQSIANCSHAKSNESAAVTIGISPSFVNLDYYVRQTAAHEFAHMIQFVNQAVIAGRLGGSPGAISEGFAELSRDYALGSPDYANISQNSGAHYLQAPQNYSILSMRGLENGSVSGYTYGNYGGAYLLMRYLADRVGPGFAKTYIQNDPLTSNAASFEALASAAGRPSFAQLFDEFGGALAATQAGLPSHEPYTFNSFSLSGSYTGPTPYAASATFQLPGVGVAAVLRNGTTSVPMFSGGVSVVALPHVSVRSTVTVTDPTSALGIGGVIAAK